MSSMFEEVKKKEEVKLEEFRKRLKEYENDPIRLRDTVDYLILYMIRDIFKTNADTMTKVEAVVHLGELYTIFDDALTIISLFEATYDWPSLDKMLMDNFAFALRSTGEKLIELYEGLKEGQPLDKIKESLQYLAWKAEEDTIMANAIELIKRMRRY